MAALAATHNRIFVAVNDAVTVVDAVTTGYFLSHLQHLAFVKLRGREYP